jgi:hypothetical protein
MSKHHETENEEPKLPPVWQQVQSAIWLVGLAILFWQDWIFPGILVLVAISGVTQALLFAYVKRQESTRAVEQARELNLPSNCANCGGPITKQTVRWTGTASALCPYCGAAIKLIDTPTTVVTGASR